MQMDIQEEMNDLDSQLQCQILAIEHDLSDKWSNTELAGAHQADHLALSFRGTPRDPDQFQPVQPMPPRHDNLTHSKPAQVKETDDVFLTTTANAPISPRRNKVLQVLNKNKSKFNQASLDHSFQAYKKTIDA
jgi:hypothetical protein